MPFLSIPLGGYHLCLEALGALGSGRGVASGSTGHLEGNGTAEGAGVVVVGNLQEAVAGNTAAGTSAGGAGRDLDGEGL
jgi:hypothetical protein